MKFNILSVNEDGGVSSRLTGVQRNFHTSGDNTLRISVSEKGNLMLVRTFNGKSTAFDFDRADIDGIIDFFKEAKIFMDEARLVEKLTGKR